MAAAMIRALRTRGSSFAAPQAVPEEQAEKLRALGYLGGATATPDGARLPDPKTRIHVLAAVREAFKLVAGGNDEAALVAFRKILAENPGFFDVQYEMGRTLARLGRFEEAARVFAEAAAHSPALLEPIAIAQARVMLALGRYDEAAANARVATALSPGQAHEILARVALARDDLAGAEKEAGLTRGDTMAELNAALLLAEVQMRRDRVLAALEILDHTRARLAGEKLPALRDLQFLRGDALARLGRNAEAEAAFREEIAAFPTNSQAYARLAIVLGIQGRSVAEVGGLLERMMTANPGAGTARLAAKTLESMGDKVRAAAWRARATSTH
jgi:tetratricopeptide (TPR) repeat protein